MIRALIALISFFTCTSLVAQQPEHDIVLIALAGKLTDEDQVETSHLNKETSTPIKAPTKPTQRFKYGARGGISSSFLSSSPAGYSVSSQIGFNAGIYLRIYIFKKLYVQPEVNYFFTSYKFKRTITPDLGKEDKVNTHALQIPILAGYTLVEQSKIMILVQTGPAIGINLKVSDNEVDVRSDDFNTTYWNWVADAQIRITKFTIQGGFVAGISKYAYGARSHSWYVGMGFAL